MNTVENSVFKKNHYQGISGKIWQEFLRQKMGGQKKMFDTGCTLYIKLIFVRTDNFRQFRPLLSPLWIPPAWQPFRH